jgi:hypothetical protein
MKDFLPDTFACSFRPVSLLKILITLVILTSPAILYADASVVVGSVRIQMLSGSLVRLEAKGAEGFEDRDTFHVVNRNWPGTGYTSNLVSGEIGLSTAGYTVYVPAGATSLSGIRVTSPTGQVLYQYGGLLTNSIWLPGPAENPQVISFADTPRLIPPSWGLTPAPPASPLASTSGWDTNNDAPDVYVFVPGGSYQQLRQDFLHLTGPTEMIPLYALGAFDSHWYDYTEATALAQIGSYRSHSMPLDILVCDTGWRLGASIGYQPNTNLFPNLPRFLSEAHAANVRVMFNDHPEPAGTYALDPVELTYRYTNLTQILGAGLDIWWYDRNWPITLYSPSPNLSYETWGMKVYHDATYGTNAPLRPMIMANVDGIDNGIRNRPMDVNAHTYPIQWTGDIRPSMTYLKYAIENAVNSGVACLFPYESDDLGGHVSDPTPGDYIRWIEYGTLSPVYRPHCTLNLNRMPWTFGPDAEWTARRFLNLRYRLLPVWYAAARNNYDTGEPLLRRLDLDYPQYPDAARESQYLIGHSLLVSPVTQQSLVPVPAAWLTTTNGQPGLDAFYYSNTNLAGAPALTRIDPEINFNWNSGSPGGTVPAGSFSAQWVGNITVPAAVGDVTLAALADDGVQVWVDGQLCLGNWGPNSSVTTEATTVLAAGQTHQLRVQYLQLGGNDLVTLEWRAAKSVQCVWIPPGRWIDAWTGNVLRGPTTIIGAAPLEETPLYIRSGSIFPLAPEMQYTGQLPWDPVTLDAYPSTTENDPTTLYEDDTLTTAYQQGQYRNTPITTWANDASKTVSVLIGAATGTFSNASPQRSWVVRLHRPLDWTSDWVPTQVTVNGQPIGPILRYIRNSTAMPLGADNGAPDGDVFEVTVPESSVLGSNLVTATFTSSLSPWVCGDMGDTGANGNVHEGGSICSNAVWVVRGGGAGIGGTNDGFHYLYQPCVGNAELTVHLESQRSTNAWAEAGIMISESLSSSARNALVAFTPGNGLVFQDRSVAGTAGQTDRILGFSSPGWLRLLRSGDSLIGYVSRDDVQWTQVGAVTIPGFSSQAYMGLAVTADTSTQIAQENMDCTNSAGNVIVGASAETLNGVYSVDDTNYNQAVFDHLSFNASVSISTVPNQTIRQSAATAPIPFTTGSGSSGTLSVVGASSNTNLLSPQGITFGGTDGNRTVTLTPNPGISGTSTITLMLSDGVTSASTQFTLTVLPYSGALMSETFDNYSAGNLPGQAYEGLGFAQNGSWVGLDSTFAGGVADAATVSSVGLASPLISATGGEATVKGDGSNLEAFPDLSAAGPFASAGLLDSASDTVGAGEVSGSLYLSFLIRSHFNKTGANAYGGLHLSRGDDSSGVLIGDSLPAWAFSLWNPQANTSVDLDDLAGNYQFVDTNTHLLVAHILYQPGGQDTITAWLDPNSMTDEDNQDDPNTYFGTTSGDFSFDRFFLRGGYSSASFDYGDITFGTTWRSVLPVTNLVSALPPAIQSPAFLTDGALSFIFTGPAGQSYSILATTNLSEPFPDWTVVGTGTFGFSPANYQDQQVTRFTQRFYTVELSQSGPF